MAENIPPSTSTGPSTTDAKPNGNGNVGANNESTARGLPYYEKLRRDLRDTIQKKRILDKNLATIEDTLLRYETTYLEETSPAGNIIKGFDNYIKGSSITTSGTGSASGTGSGTISGSALGGAGAASRKKAAIVDSDRVFSRSSVGSNVKTEIGGGPGPGADGGLGADSPSTTTAAGTPMASGGVGAAAGGGEKKGAGNKKGGNKKKTHASSAAVADDEGGSSAAEATATGTKKNKRLKVSYGRD